MNRKITEDDFNELLRLQGLKMHFVAQQAFTGFRYAYKKEPQKIAGCQWNRGGKGIPVTAGRLLFVKNEDKSALNIDKAIEEYIKNHKESSNAEG